MPPREFLKAQTRTAHERVDNAFMRFDLSQLAGYRCFLEAHHAVLPACERVLALSGAATLLADWPTRVRTPALKHDLMTLRGHQPDATGCTVPIVPAAAFGMLYVLEGSRIGGAVLASRLPANSDAIRQGATKYLRHGEGLHLWSSFVAALNASPVVCAQMDAVLASALHTFTLFEVAAKKSNASLPPFQSI